MKHHCIQLTLSCSLAAVLAGALAQPARAGNGIDTWSGGSGTSSNWSDPANWNPANSTNVPPLAGDLLVFSGSSRPAPNNDYAPGTAFDGISLNTSVPFVLGGNSVLLSGNFLAVSNGIVNNSGFFQTVNLNVNLDWGYHLFTSPAGTLALDGSITPGTGSVAYFGPNNVNSTALAVDRSGLISGLNSDAFIVNSAGGVAGLATLDATGTNIVQYLFSASAQFGSGTLPTDGVNGTNIETTANTTTTYTFPGSPDGNLYVNAIQVDAAAAATTLAWGSASTHTNLVLGTVNGIGAIYTPNTTTAGRLVIGSGNGSFLTAGPMTGNPVPGQIIFAINGSNTSNEAENNANTIDNASGGAVTVVKAGTGSMYFNQTNNYSGGTYIAQGYLQGNTAQAFGTGPVYVAAGSTVFPQHNGGIYPNNFYLSPGFGFPGNSPATVGAMKFAAANAGASGTITLEGPSVTNAPGDRISESSSGGVITLSGQITGTGTLDFYANAATTTMFLSNVTANANNWTGGLIVNGANNDSAYLRLGAANQLANNDVTLAQAGTGIARLDLNGYSDTIGALNSSANGNNQVADSASAASTLTIGADNANASFGGSLQGAGLSIVKTGSGTQIFSGTNTSGGGTYVTGGALVLTGPANLNSNALVAVSGATLDLSGLDNPAGANATLSLTNSLLVIGTPNTPITNEVATTLNLGGTSNVIRFASLPLITGYPATIHVISYGTLNGAFNFMLGSLPVDSPAFKGYLTNENNFIDLVVTNGPTPVRHLTWTGNAGNAWDVATTANWKGTNGLATIYNQSDFVLFDDSASGASTVNLATALTPGTMTVSNSTVAYTFNSSGKISGDISLLKMGTNSVLFDESGGNDFTGGVLISNGIVQVGNGDGLGSIGSGPVVNNGALILNRGSTSVISNAISGLGSLTQEGGDTVVLAGNNSFTGAALVESNSVLMLGASAALGSSTAVADGSRLDLNGFMAGGSVIAQGNGGGNGAVDNSSTNIPAGYTGVTNLTLTGDTTIGASGNRWDLRAPGGTGGDPSGAVLSTGGQPYNLAKTGTGGGTGFIGLVSVTVDTNLANIDVQQGTLEVEGNTTGLGNPTNTLTVESGATLELFSATNHFNKVIQLDDGGTIMNGSGANIIVGPMVVTNPGFSSYCTFVINGTSLTLTNVITGDGTIYRTLTGSNALYLNGNSPDFAGGLYLGGGVTVLNGTLNNGLGAQVSNGKFYVNGELQGSGITGGFQGTVLGTGIVDGASTISGTLDPGDVGTPGTFTVGGLTIGALATLNFDLGNDTTPGNATNDLVVVNGDLTVNGGTININPLG
ncbi:MAG TPA: autotransporter-associated beta strand repeat-containing protein, partial [Verrucomicrobiae bacterium]|nr:autotransporter-associated beta strand repeat-containing protein [Verrucomicrobiae bacterium]